MKNLIIGLMLTVMCLLGCVSALTSKDMNQFVAGSLAMCISAIAFLIHAKYPLFNENN
jgi:hypothetical protein